MPAPKKQARTCLLVDDNASLRRALAKLLREECAIETREAQDGLRALTVLEQRTFDVIVCDQRMPGGPQGMTVLETAKDRWPLMWRVLYTAYSRAEQFDGGYADLVLDKMLDPRTVAEQICAIAGATR